MTLMSDSDLRILARKIEKPMSMAEAYRQIKPPYTLRAFQNYCWQAYARGFLKFNKKTHKFVYDVKVFDSIHSVERAGVLLTSTPNKLLKLWIKTIESGDTTELLNQLKILKDHYDWDTTAEWLARWADSPAQMLEMGTIQWNNLPQAERDGITQRANE